MGPKEIYLTPKRAEYLDTLKISNNENQTLLPSSLSSKNSYQSYWEAVTRVIQTVACF
jgi:hypothetical protein